MHAAFHIVHTPNVHKFDPRKKQVIEQLIQEFVNTSYSYVSLTTFHSVKDIVYKTLNVDRIVDDALNIETNAAKYIIYLTLYMTHYTEKDYIQNIFRYENTKPRFY